MMALMSRGATCSVDAIAARVIGLVQTIAAVECRPDDPLISTGLLDSVALADLVLALDESFDVELPLELLTDGRIDSADQFAEHVARLRGTHR